MRFDWFNLEDKTEMLYKNQYNLGFMGLYVIFS